MTAYAFGSDEALTPTGTITLIAKDSNGVTVNSVPVGDTIYLEASVSDNAAEQPITFDTTNAGSGSLAASTVYTGTGLPGDSPLGVARTTFATLNPSTISFSAQNSSYATQGATTCSAVGVGSIQYESAPGSWSAITSTLFITKGSTINLKAIPDPSTAPWPTNKPAWSGSAGATGNGDSKSVTLNTTATSTTDFKTAIATCGNNKTANIIVVEMDKLQYKKPDNTWADVSGTMYVVKNGSIDFKAIPKPAGATWPSGMPTWSGTATGSGETKTVAFGTTSTAADNYKVVTATCSSAASANVVVVDLSITKPDGTAAATTANVARYQALKATIAPAGLTITDYQWKINNSATPPRTIAIKTYTQNPLVGCTPTDLSAGTPAAPPAPAVLGDLQKADLTFYYTDESGAQGTANQPVDLSIKISGFTLDAPSLQVKVTFENDMNNAIYAQETPAAPDNPGNFNTNRDHIGWHFTDFETATIRNHDANMFTAAYGGKAFFDFHKSIIQAYGEWRSLFHVPVGRADSNDNTPANVARNALPSYLEATGGNTRSPIYGYVRLGEIPSVEQLGDIIVSPYHNGGHEAAGGDMAGTHAPKTAANRFWTWHGHLELFNSQFAANQDQATPVKPGFTAGAGAGTITIAFDLPVSNDSAANVPANFDSNNVEIKAASLTVDGIAATAISASADFKTFTFTVQHLTAGDHTVVLTGTTSFKSSPAVGQPGHGDWKITVP